MAGIRRAYGMTQGAGRLSTQGKGVAYAMNESGMSDDDKRSIYYVLGTVDDLVGDFLYYGRKEDEDLPRGEIERLIGKGSLTVDEIVERFRSALVSELPATDKTEAS